MVGNCKLGYSHDKQIKTQKHLDKVNQYLQQVGLSYEILKEAVRKGNLELTSFSMGDNFKQLIEVTKRNAKLQSHSKSTENSK